MTCDLISSARASYNLNSLVLTDDEYATLTALITAVSAAISRFCRREFCSQEWDELYDGSGTDVLPLRQFPVVKVSRVACCPRPVLTVKNTATSTNQRATVRVTATGLELVRAASGTVTTDTSVAWAGNATLADLKTAIDALGNGWSASVVAGYESWRSADLRDFQGALKCLGTDAPLKLHVEELTGYEIDDRKGWLIRTDGLLFPGDDGTGWAVGRKWWRVIYTAGYATIPEDVQEACAEWVAALFWQTKRDPGLSQESIPAVVSRSILQGIPPGVRQLLLPYRKHTLGYEGY